MLKMLENQSLNKMSNLSVQGWPLNFQNKSQLMKGTNKYLLVCVKTTKFWIKTFLLCGLCLKLLKCF